MRIWKYPLGLIDEQTVFVPQGTVPLTAQLQHGALQLWAQVDENETARKPDQALRIGIFGTGNPMPDNPGRYLSTFQLRGGDLGFHVYVMP